MVIVGGSLAIAESNSSSLTISGNISDDNGAESLTLLGDGSGELVLSGNNTYGGGTDVEGGILEVTKSNALPSGSGLTVGSGGTVVFGDPSGAGVTMVATAAAGGFARRLGCPVPEPGTLVLLGVAGIVAAAAAWRRSTNGN